MTVIRIVLGVLLLLILLDFGAAGALVRAAFVRSAAMAEDPKPDDTPAWQEYYRRAEDGKKWIAEQPCESWETRSFDGLKLCAAFLPAEEKTDKTVLCIHGYRANGCFDFGAAAPFLRGLGWNVLMPDDRAHGKSEGKYIGFGNPDSQDCLQWCRVLTERLGKNSSIVLYGVSMGGAAVLAAAGDGALPDAVKGVVADCGFSSGWEEVRLQLKNQFHLPVWPLLPTANLILRRRAGYSLKERAALDRVKNIRVPLLIIHGTADTFVPTAMGRALFDAAGTPDKQLLLVDGAVHAHSYLTDTAGYEAAFRELIAKTEKTEAGRL